MPFADAFDRCAQLVDFGTEVLQRVAVQQSRLAMHVQLSVCIGKGEHGFLHGWICNRPCHQNAPGHQRSVVLVLKGIRPSRAQQRPVGERAFQAHPIEYLLGAVKFVFTQKF